MVTLPLWVGRPARASGLVAAHWLPSMQCGKNTRPIYADFRPVYGLKRMVPWFPPPFPSLLRLVFFLGKFTVVPK